MIIPTLYRYQKRRGGYLTRDDLKRIARDLNTPLYRIQSLVSFFPHFRMEPPPPISVHICQDMSCHLRGSVQLKEKVAAYAQGEFGDRAEVGGVSCLGRCDRAPAATINEQLCLAGDVSELCDAMDRLGRGETWNCDRDADHTMRGQDEWEIDIYGDPSDYRTVRQYLKASDPAQALTALETAGLLGMGGAGGRAYLKWGDVLAAEGTEKFVVCNADESEPGTFKDRELMLHHPHLVIEGMIIAALVTGAQRGWIYVRHEYPEQIEALREEIGRAVALGALGSEIFHSDESFELEVYVSPGGYICGEQTALIEAMEDKRAEPRNRPPELMTNGFRNQPTLLNNVETFAWVPAIMDHEAGAWFRDEGRKSGPFSVAGQEERMRGRRLFSISGDVAQPGVYEVPTGIPLGELIDRQAGGMRDGCQLAAVALSGPSGGLWPAQIPVAELNAGFVKRYVTAGTKFVDIRELPLDINVSRAVGFMLGAGIVVYGDQADLLAEVLACSRFFRNESCGKCVPCRIGSAKVTALGTQLQQGRLSPEQLPVLRGTIKELGDVMEATSICGLGQVASNPLRHFLRFFPDLAAQACHGETAPETP